MSERPADAYTVLPAADHRKMRWLNGGGWTSEIIAWPDPKNWEWRLSVADIEQGGPFSVFAGVNRTIALLQGSGFTLTAENLPTVTITSPYEPFDFPGDEPTNCSLLNGPVQDLNLMVRRSSTPRHLRFAAITDTIELVDIELAIVVSGHPHLGDIQLARLDAIRPLFDSLTLVLSPPYPEPATIAIVT
jgi:uncharacterized protein